MKKIPCSIAALVLVFLTALPAAAEPRQDAAKIQALVSRVVAAYGGKRTLAQLSSIYRQGRISALAFDDQGTSTIYFKRPRKLLVDIRYSRSQEIRILDGNKGYYGAGNELPQKVRGFRLLAIVYQYQSQDIPFGLLQGVYKLKYEGRAEVDGSQTTVLGLKSKEGPPMKIDVDTSTFLIRKISGLFSVEGSSMVLSSEFSDFRAVGGTVLPYKITNFAAGQKIAETVVTMYRVNQPMKDSLFNPSTPRP